MEKRTNKISCLGGGFLFLLSLLAVFVPGYGIYRIFHTYWMLYKWERTEGIITYLDFVEDDEGGGVFYPNVRFTTAQGQEVRFTEETGSYPPAYDVGQTVRVVYDPNDVHKARIINWFGLWFAPLMLTSSGSILLYFVGILVISTLKAR